MTECFSCGKKSRGRLAYQVTYTDGSHYEICSGRCLEDLALSEQGEGR